MRHTMGNRAAIIVITIMWLVTVPSALFFFTRIIGWPLDFTLLVFVPTLLFFIPGGYVLAIAGGERHRRGLGLGLSRDYLVRVFVFGLLLCLLTMSGVWVYGQLKAAIYLGAVIAGLIGVVSAWAAVRAFRRLLSDMRGGKDEIPPGKGGGRV